MSGLNAISFKKNGFSNKRCYFEFPIIPLDVTFEAVFFLPLRSRRYASNKNGKINLRELVLKLKKIFVRREARCRVAGTT